MKVILYKDVPDLGEEGDVKVVADGYARNYLIPQEFAVRYSKVTETELAQKQQAILRRRQEKNRSALDAKSKIESFEMELAVAAGEKGKLFGSVTSSAVVEWLAAQGVKVERKRIELPEGGIKMLGVHTVGVRLYGGEQASLKVKVVPPGENIPNAKKDRNDDVKKQAVEDAKVMSSQEVLASETSSEDASADSKDEADTQ